LAKAKEAEAAAGAAAEKAEEQLVDAENQYSQLHPEQIGLSPLPPGAIDTEAEELAATQRDEALRAEAAAKARLAEATKALLAAELGGLGAERDAAAALVAKRKAYADAVSMMQDAERSLRTVPGFSAARNDAVDTFAVSGSKAMLLPFVDSGGKQRLAWFHWSLVDIFYNNEARGKVTSAVPGLTADAVRPMTTQLKMREALVSQIFSDKVREALLMYYKEHPDVVTAVKFLWDIGRKMLFVKGSTRRVWSPDAAECLYMAEVSERGGGGGVRNEMRAFPAA
jgi:hypothetical protein